MSAMTTRIDEEEDSLFSEGDFFTTVEHYSQYKTAGYAVFKTYKKELLPLKTLSQVSPLPCGHLTSNKNGCSIWLFPAIRVDHATKEIVLVASCRSGIKHTSTASKKQCEHNQVRGTCKECGGLQICEHNQVYGTCIDCVSFENAMARGWLCKICGTTKTKAGVCTGNPEWDLSDIIGGAGATDCATSLEREFGSTRLTKIGTSSTIRPGYDTLQFGTAVLLPTQVFCFNPHDTPALKFEFSSKLKVLVQWVCNYLNEELDMGAAPVASVEWLYYGQGSNQRMFAEHASATLHILPDVNDLNIALDADIAVLV
ncbi:hypothetical protein HDU80_007772 [Chytriomyces hyalinus]|nr:hypothetical protein HDU80_007772 [Chytriomyces hyalinus]